MDGFDAFGGRVGLFGHQQFQGIQGGGHVAAENFQELQVAFAERPRLHAFHVERADHFVMQQQRHGQRTLGPADAFQEQRVLGRVLAKVTLAGGRHEARDAVALREGKKLASRRGGIHAYGQQRLQAVRLPVQEANFRHFKVQEILGEVDDVRLQKLDPVADRHLEDFLGSQIGQFHARLVDRRQFLLLLSNTYCHT